MLHAVSEETEKCTMYIGEPHRVPAMTPDSRNRAKPKSAEHTKHKADMNNTATGGNIINSIRRREWLTDDSHKQARLASVTD